MELPFSEKITKNTSIRTFDQSIEEDELVWHRDKEDRTVQILEETDWMFQYDNELPFVMKEEFFVPKLIYHRVIKGTGILKLEITKH